MSTDEELEAAEASIRIARKIVRARPHIASLSRALAKAERDLDNASKSLQAVIVTPEIVEILRTNSGLKLPRHNRIDNPNHHQRIELIVRNGRWGTCVSCPQRPDGTVTPENCAEGARCDHHIDNDLSFEDLEFVRSFVVKLTTTSPASRIDEIVSDDSK